MIEDRSFGIIPIKKTEEGWKILLVFHKGGKHWGFPKGHKHEPESDIDAAVRELKEETGLEIVAVLSKEPFTEQYSFYKKHEKVSKTVSYYPAFVQGTLKLQPEEILDARWLSFEDAMRHLTFIEAKNMCQCVRELTSLNF